MRRGVLLGGLLLSLVLLAWAVSLLVAYDAVSDVDISRASALPSLGHLLGTDHLGRDVSWRLITATLSFVGPGLVACILAALLSICAGALAGWYGGWIGEGFRYLFTVISAIPRFVLVLLVCSIYGSTVWNIALASALAYSPKMVESIYNRIAYFRVAEFVLAAEAHGVHPRRILSYHLVWVNCRYLIFRHMLTLFSYFLLVETTLSFIGGFGVVEPQPSWGNMIAFEWGVRDGNPWATFAPAIAIWAVILGCALLVEGIREDEHA
ncbi:MAG: ABC transporter permease [Myxococcota bacterium]|nr:ABC transporter permease [Myxococcota bacterium]